MVKAALHTAGGQEGSCDPPHPSVRGTVNKPGWNDTSHLDTAEYPGSSLLGEYPAQQEWDGLLTVLLCLAAGQTQSHSKRLSDLNPYFLFILVSISQPQFPHEQKSKGTYHLGNR